MDHNKRIRVVFKDDDILNETQKFEGLNRSWVLLKLEQHATVSDIASHLLHAFQLHNSCPHGLLLSISGFILPPFESTCILKDNEIVRVRKRREPLCIEGNGVANEVQKLKAAGKKPINTRVLLLANKEFEEEKGGYESEHPEEESGEGFEEDLVEDIEISGEKAYFKNRKRKAAELKGSTSKRKKQRSEAHGDIAENAHKESNETCDQDAELTKKKNISKRKKRNHSNGDDIVENNEENAKLDDKIDEPGSNMNGNSEVQENNKETEDVNTPTKAANKVPSRSARRKYEKRRFKREMAKIQKINAVCESESLRNWKEDQAKAERNKAGGHLKGLQKWKKNQTDAETNDVDDQPKGLLHWKQSFQGNPLDKGKKRRLRNQDTSFHKYSEQNGYLPKQFDQNDKVHEQQNQNTDVHEQPNEKPVYVQEQPKNEDSFVLEKLNQKNGEVRDLTNSEDVEESEVVPVVIRPGHIRFEPLEKEQVAPQNHVTLQASLNGAHCHKQLLWNEMEIFKWNGITSKKKGQKWGIETSSFIPRTDYSKSSTEHSDVTNDEKGKQPDGGIDLDKLPPLPSIPKEGDVIAYRILELSSSWTPELSAYRVGKVSRFDAESNQTLLVPVSEYPIGSQKADEDGEVTPSDNSLYKEDGSLEIDFSSLVDVRIFKDGSVGPRNDDSSWQGGLALQQNASKTVAPSSHTEQTVVPNGGIEGLSRGEETQTIAENGGSSLWDQISEALTAKKEQLCRENSWGKTPTKLQPPQINNSWEKVNNEVPSVPDNSGGKNMKKVQPSQQSSQAKQSSSSGKSWSYKALRGSALGPTMAMLRSKTDA